MTLFALALVSCAGGASDDLAAAVGRFWAADPVHRRRAIAREIVASGAGFDEVLAALREGRAYPADVARGRLLRERTDGRGVRYPYQILVPEDYEPDVPLPVRFELHGGMGAEEWVELDGAWSPGWRPVPGQIVVLPAGWWDSMWWEHGQVENFEAILREVRATWNVDENRVVLVGSSDGGAGLFFQAMRTPDRWAGYAGFVAPPDRLVRADFRPDGQMHPSNLFGQRFLLAYGERDKLVPWRYAEAYLELFERSGAVLEAYVLEGQGHQLSLPREREQELARFLWHTVRDPLPDRLSWATERTDRYHRRSWLVIDELEEPGPDHRVDESNVLPRLGTPLQRRGPTVERVPWGRVELERDGNRIRATTRRVERFTLLLSPDELDLSSPVVVEVDGEVVHDAPITPSVETLLEWAAVDDDRTVFFAAELTID